MIDRDFGNWLAGFIDGEGCFYITRDSSRGVYKVRFALSVRSDDRKVVDECQARTGIGTIHEYKATTGSMITRWNVQSRGDCERLVLILDKCQLRAKKKTDYEIWKRGVEIQKNIRAGRADNTSVQAEMTALKAELAIARKAGITW